MRILLVGSGGLLGTELKKVFSDVDLLTPRQSELDIADKSAVFEYVKKQKPKVIINAAAYTKVDDAQGQKDIAMQINGEAVGYLAEAANSVDAVLVHYSTDYVFEGTKTSGYKEDDEPAETPASVYGQSKLLGEELLQKKHDKFYLIRTAWLFGENGPDFIDTVVRLAAKNKKMRIVADQHGKPTYVADLAIATKGLLFGEEGEYDYGIYHLVNEVPTTWYEYAQTIVALLGKKNNWEPKDYPKIAPVESSEFSTKAKRPEYSILLNTKAPLLRPWQEALAEYIEKTQ